MQLQKIGTQFVIENSVASGSKTTFTRKCVAVRLVGFLVTLAWTNGLYEVGGLIKYT